MSVSYLVTRAKTPEERQERFREFDRGALNIMKLALAYDLTPTLFAQVESDIRRSITPYCRVEMLLYTDKIDIVVSGRTSVRRHGWLWRKRTVYKYLNADIIFEPYKSSLSVWTDPTAPGGIVCFQ
jgi:hypothetical protein